MNLVTLFFLVQIDQKECLATLKVLVHDFSQKSEDSLT